LEIEDDRDSEVNEEEKIIDVVNIDKDIEI